MVSFSGLVPNFEEVYGRKPTFAELRQAIQEFSCSSWIRELVRLSVLVDGKQRSLAADNELQISLIPQLFGGIQQTAIQRFLDKHHPADFRIVHSLQVQTLVQLVLCFAPEEGNEIRGESGRYALGRALLAANDLCFPEYTQHTDQSAKEDELRKHMGHGQLRSVSEKHLERAWRMKSILIDRLDATDPPPPVNLRAVFRRLASLAIEDAYAIGVVQCGVSALSDPGDRFEVPTFARISEKQTAELLSLAASTKDDLVRDILRCDSPLEEPHRFGFAALRRHPLVRIRERTVLTGLAFLQEWSTTGLYYLLADEIERVEGEKSRGLFSAWFGDAFERYCRSLVPAEWDASVVACSDEPRKGGDLHPPDLVLRWGDDLVVVETKAFRSNLAYEKNTKELLPEREAEFVRRFGAQLKRDIAVLLDGGFGLGDTAKSVRRVFPVAVSFDRYPVEFLAHEAVQENCREAGLFSDARIQPVEVLHVSDWEHALARGSVLDLATLLARRQSEADRVLRGCSLSNYLYTLGDPTDCYRTVIVPRMQECLLFATARLLGPEAADQIRKSRKPNG